MTMDDGADKWMDYQSVPVPAVMRTDDADGATPMMDDDEAGTDHRSVPVLVTVLAAATKDDGLTATTTTDDLDCHLSVQAATMVCSLATVTDDDVGRRW